MPTRRIGPKGLALIKSFESFVPYVYDDLVPPKGGKYAEWVGPAVKGTLTIGYGHTDAAKHPLKIKQGLRINEGQALVILDTDLDECEEAVNKMVTKPLTQGQFDACVSFTFNCGAGNFKNIAERINRGDYQAARDAFAFYTKSMGKTLAGLVRRRGAEQALWDAKDYVLPIEPVHHSAIVDEEPIRHPQQPRPSGPTPPSAGRPVESSKPVQPRADGAPARGDSGAEAAPAPGKGGPMAALAALIALFTAAFSGFRWEVIVAVLAAIGIVALGVYLIKKRG